MVPQEYEQGVTPEAKFVKDLDRLEMAIQGTSPRIGGVRADRISLVVYSPRVRESARTRSERSTVLLRQQLAVSATPRGMSVGEHVGVGEGEGSAGGCRRSWWGVVLSWRRDG
jgi:hypothetical protein